MLKMNLGFDMMEKCYNHDAGSAEVQTIVVGMNGGKQSLYGLE